LHLAVINKQVIQAITSVQAMTNDGLEIRYCWNV